MAAINLLLTRAPLVDDWHRLRIYHAVETLWRSLERPTTRYGLAGGWLQRAPVTELCRYCGEPLPHTLAHCLAFGRFTER